MRTYRRALITGASSGIGAAFAQALPPATDLMLAGRDQERLDEAVVAAAADGRTVDTYAGDLTEAASREMLVERAEAFGIDLLINNAGAGKVGRFLDSPAEAEVGTVLLNVVAVVDLTRRLLPGMLARARREGRRCGVVIISSTTAFAPVPFFATYAASKAFDLHFAEALAEELRSEPVDILALCPGATRTGFGRNAGFEPGDLPGASQPGDVAETALQALGQRTVAVAGRIDRAVLQPTLLPRRVLAGAVGAAMRLVMARNG